MIVRGVSTERSSGQLAEAASLRRLPVWLTIVDAAHRRHSVVACDPVEVFRGTNVDELAEAWRRQREVWKAPEDPGVPIGMGFLSYDLGRRLEMRRSQVLPESPWADIEFRFHDAVLVHDCDSGRCRIYAQDESAATRLDQALLPPGKRESGEPAAWPAGPLRELEPPERHLAAVSRALAYVEAGDIYQVNLARRLGCHFPSPAGAAPGLALFAKLESTVPASHAIWLANGETGEALVGNSPERFLRLGIDGRIETWPIKGTRPRPSDGSDRMAKELLGSAKDRAEHVMIVDLERNDLGRVCQTGSVKVEVLGRMLTLPTVHHLVSIVSGQLRPDVGLSDLLRATFPGGSVTGAPKIRAMEIIEELEPARRGPYTGATGWLGAAGDLDLGLAIRTALVRADQLTLWVGGGIVADSVPEQELAETWDKARAFQSLLGALA